ncbi:MAG: hypothetical protein DRN21_04165 [Thermoplasmata archaeon]|nr:MAG: hypothetical protein DRN21_04165 [Thermoplasmata archaeon]
MPERVRKKLREMFIHWGFGETEADISAILATRDGLTAREISDEVGCAYSTAINSLNQLRRMGYINRAKQNRKFVYSFSTDFVSLINRDAQKLIQGFRDLSREIHHAGENYRGKIAELKKKVEKALQYLEKERTEECP